jgi:hypothetical protein
LIIIAYHHEQPCPWDSSHAMFHKHGAYRGLDMIHKKGLTYETTF